MQIYCQLTKRIFYGKRLSVSQAILAGMDVARGQIDLPFRLPGLRLALKRLPRRGRNRGAARRWACQVKRKELALADQV